MIWTYIFLFLAIVAAVLGFLGLGFGPIQSAKVAFYIITVFLVISFVMERRKKSKKYYE
ncbi:MULTISPECIES: DUF1328 domain-containing protein [Aequorivita]|uniref:DUF1328 domain-containing protein n=2 Tax=Aequorivita TaxID=153265 RepID=A0AB35YSV0_9FLAO|nr:DUF1328 domain-containing protein [Aequorivita sp. Ant34-E75]WGF92440.1 DUF1328 domain-containing protein [Aequorivita sp. Ant34-E75]